MNELQLKVFNVGHGLSVMIREIPNNFITLFDLGADANMSPLNYLRKRELIVNQLYITHPHGDHISEIDKLLYASYQPKRFYIQEYDWDDVASREQEHLREKVKILKTIKNTIPNGIDSGFGNFKFWHYTPKLAKEIFGENNYINNSSIAGVYTWRDFKIVILGDLETEALKRYCLFDDFIKIAKNPTIFIAPHHAHNSGFPELWVEKIGKPDITIASIKESDPHICKKYESSDFNNGLTIQGKTRYCLTTRNDGTITVNMYYLNNFPKMLFSFE